ncbi:hypothetical protein VIGAN_11221900 [Vigna angularis var. angularis]|uniref:Endoplasmic reticulum transmembrane protein n=1 Tax=Vigna angularis var. angularis TaxID=157739 RepID=A0A0S3TC80_PHAAN|nr:hypothetical protein VIGAN_11221900 [Vigna angularis var. angularis]
MALQWLILTYVVAAEAAVAILLTLPTPKLLRNRFASLVSLILQPALFIVPFAGFHLLDIYWKNEHRLMCTSEVCTAAERDRYEKSVSISCECEDGLVGMFCIVNCGHCVFYTLCKLLIVLVDTEKDHFKDLTNINFKFRTI